jgi:hypothetical protein
LKRQAVKRFHPDNAIDAEDEVRLTGLMQEANAAFDARDEARLRSVFLPTHPSSPPVDSDAYERGITKNRLRQRPIDRRLRLILNILGHRLRHMNLHHDYTLVI